MKRILGSLFSIAVVLSLGCSGDKSSHAVQGSSGPTSGQHLSAPPQAKPPPVVPSK